MKLWFRLTLVCCVLVGVLLSLTQAVSLNYRLPVVGSGPSFDRGRGSASEASTVALLRSIEFHLARAGPLESLVSDYALTAGNISPPGQETYGPPEPMGPWRVAGQAGNSNQRHRATFSPKLLALTADVQESGFCNTL